MNRAPELQKLLNDWLAFAGENLLYAKAGMEAEFSPYNTILTNSFLKPIY